MRLHRIDALRGYAVFVMLLANTFPYTLGTDLSLFWRLIFSSAAPIFVFISGYTSQMNLSKQGASTTKYLKRVLQIFFIGAFIDAAFWDILPFYTFDVLYLLAFLQLILLLLNREEGFFLKSLLTVVVLAGTFYLHTRYPYRFEVNEISLSDFFQGRGEAYSFSSAVKRFLFDGWFPAFPWLLWGILGALSFRFRQFFSLSWRKWLFLWMGLICLIAFVVVSWNTVFQTRDKYLEIWYPLAGIKLIFVLSICLLAIFYLLTEDGESKSIPVLDTIGKNSLFIYLFHSGIIGIVSRYLDPTQSPNITLLVFILCVVLPIAVSSGMEKLKSLPVWRATPAFIKFVLGY